MRSSTRSSTELDYRGTNFEDFPDEALPLIEVSDDKEVLKVNEEAVELLRRIDCAICPISIVGLYRTGKSSLLNFFPWRQGRLSHRSQCFEMHERRLDLWPADESYLRRRDASSGRPPRYGGRRRSRGRPEVRLSLIHI